MTAAAAVAVAASMETLGKAPDADTLLPYNNWMLLRCNTADCHFSHSIDRCLKHAGVLLPSLLPSPTAPDLAPSPQVVQHGAAGRVPADLQGAGAT